MRIPLKCAERALESGVSFADSSAQSDGLMREIAMFERDFTPLEKRLKQCRDELDKITKSLASLKAPNFSGRKPAAFRDYTESVRELSQAVNLMTRALVGLDIVYELKQEAKRALESGVSFANPDKNQYQARIDNLVRAHGAVNKAFLTDPLANPRFRQALEYSKKFAPYDVSKIESAARDLNKHMASLKIQLQVLYDNALERAERDGVRVKSRL